MESELFGKRVAVLGCNSFGGASLVRSLLVSGADVLGFNRSSEGSKIFLQYRFSPIIGRYKFVKADVNSDLDLILQELTNFHPSVIVDFAGQGMVAESWDNPDQWYTTNIVAKVRLHDALRRLACMKRYVRVSTPEVYGSHADLHRETWDFNPSTPYAVSHAAIDMSLRAFHQRYEFPVIFGRFANFYGPGQQLYRIIPRAIICALLQRKLPLHGGGTAVRAFIYGTDVADAIIRSMLFGVPGEVYHFSPGEFYSIREIVESIASELNVSFERLVEFSSDRPSKDSAYRMDSTKAQRQLGWLPRTEFRTGLIETIHWISENLDEIKSLPFDYVHKV